MKELGLTLRGAAERSGGLVSHANIANIVHGTHGPAYSERTMKGLALAIDVPYSRVVEAVEKGLPDDFRLPKKARDLTMAQRRAVLSMIDALLADNR